MNIQQFVSKAQQGGWNTGRKIQIEDSWGISHDLACQILLDPLAWKAVGEVDGWGSARVLGKYGITERNTYVHYMHSFIDHLCDGLTLEEALEKATS